MNLFKVAAEVENALEAYCHQTIKRSSNQPIPRVAVMGCVVNGPGEAKGADIALCGGDGECLLYVKGERVSKVSEADAVKKVMEHVVSVR